MNIKKPIIILTLVGGLYLPSGIPDRGRVQSKARTTLEAREDYFGMNPTEGSLITIATQVVELPVQTSVASVEAVLVELVVQKPTKIAVTKKPTPKVAAKPALNKIIKKEAAVAKITPRNRMEQRICEVFGSKCSEALIIAKHESGFNEKVISKTNDYGVFQINCRWQKKRVGGDCGKLLDFETNLRVAKQIYSEQGWTPWSTKKYLTKR